MEISEGELYKKLYHAEKDLERYQRDGNTNMEQMMLGEVCVLKDLLGLNE